MFSLESPYRGDSNEYIQYTIINVQRKSPEIIPNTIMSAAIGAFWLGTRDRVRNSRDYRAITARATGVLL